MWMFVLVLSSDTLSNEICCGSLFLIQNHCVCVLATKVKWILFLNHMNRKVLGDRYNFLVHYVDASSTSLSGVVLCNQPFQMRYFVVHYFWSKISIFVCMPAIKVKCILFCNHRNRKVAGCQHNILVYYVDVSAPNLFGAVLCNPFK